MAKMFSIRVVHGDSHGKYVSGTATKIEMTDLNDALAWNRSAATTLCRAFNAEYNRRGLLPRFELVEREG